MNAATLAYIREHAKDDVRLLALRTVPPHVDLRAALTQIEGRQLAAHKLPTWAATDGLLYPPRLALEQCSSETTAAYKRWAVEACIQHSALNSQHLTRPYSSTFLDLTGGLGVDFTAIAPLFDHAIYVEQQVQLCDLARNNFPLLGLAQAEIRCSAAERVLPSQATETPISHLPSFILIDPARRDFAGRKVSSIEDCTPDVCAMQDQLRAAADFILIKLSPMLALTAALQALHGISECHVVSVNGECKELLLLMRGNGQENQENSTSRQDTCPIHCIDLPSHATDTDGSATRQRNKAHGGLSTDNSPCAKSMGCGDGAGHEDAIGSVASASGFTFTRAEEAATPLQLAESLATYLYEPNASILKAGAFKIICQRFPVLKLSSQAHLYTSQQLISDFPGRIWRITDNASFSKQNLRRLLSGVTAADLTVRGFPTSVATLRNQLHLREGGQGHFIATTLGQQRLLLKVERIHPTH
jgi:hypothetical protein